MKERRQIIDDQGCAQFITFSVFRRRGPVERATDWKWSSARWYEWRRSIGAPIHWVE